MLQQQHQLPFSISLRRCAQLLGSMGTADDLSTKLPTPSYSSTDSYPQPEPAFSCDLWALCGRGSGHRPDHW